jgi:rhamnogalacturonyl hydrolase YesR
MKVFISALIFALLQSPVLFAQDTLTKNSAITIMERVADWQLHTWQESGMRKPAWDWTNGACYTGFMALYKTTGDAKYSSAMYNIGQSIDWNTGPNRTMADDYCIAQTYAQLYMQYKQPEIIAHFKALADTIITLPHTEPLEMKGDIVLREWAWCDALFMGPTAFAYLSSATGERKYIDTACRLWWKTTDYLFDKDENLYYRDSKFFNRREANGKKVFWSRGNGWVLAGLVRMLQNMPPGYAERPRFIALYKKMAAKIAALQHADGTWHTSLLDSISYPAKETSGTGFYCYALAWGINNGLLPYHKYYTVVAKAWAALTACVHPDGKLGYVQQIGEKPEVVSYDDTEVYGVGAFLLAGSEMAVLEQKKHEE